MSSSELSEWQEYYSIEPFGAWRDNWHAAQQCYYIYNLHRGENPAMQVADFMFMDADTAQDKKDAEFVSMLSGLSISKKR